jgi:hypothetical protein
MHQRVQELLVATLLVSDGKCSTAHILMKAFASTWGSSTGDIRASVSSTTHGRTGQSAKEHKHGRTG